MLVDRLSLLLEPEERDAVLGDLAECRTCETEALRDVLGLVIRRHAALWKDWRPWFALVFLAGPIGLLLTYVCARLGFALQLHLRAYLNHGVFYGTGLTGG